MGERKYVHVHLIADEPGDLSVGIWSQLIYIDLRIGDTEFFKVVERADFEKAFLAFMKPWLAPEAKLMTKDVYDKRETDICAAEAAEDLL